MSKAPAFQFYASDFISDSNVVLMDLKERGAYITLLAYNWINGSIPSDMKSLSRLCSVQIEEMAQLWLSLSKCFLPCVHDVNKLSNPRLDDERKKQTSRREERSNSGKLGAKSRWYPIVQNNGKAIDLPMAEPMAKHSSSSSSSSSEKNIKKLSLRSSTKSFTDLPNNFILNNELRSLASSLKVDIESQFDQFKDYAEATGKQYKNWNAAFRNWLRRSKNFNQSRGKIYEKKLSGFAEHMQGAYERLNRKLVHEDESNLRESLEFDAG